MPLVSMRSTCSSVRFVPCVSQSMNLIEPIDNNGCAVSNYYSPGDWNFGTWYVCEVLSE